MKVLSRQRNSRMCIICGLDNEFGVRAAFYNMEDGSVMTRFQYHPNHQSYPGRVHGGLITAMLDELGLRGLWAHHGGDETDFGVTINLTTNYRKPVPYATDLIAKGVVVRETSRFVVVESQLMDMDGTVLADGTIKYIKLDTKVISGNATVHEEMPYLIDDGVTEL